MIEMTGRATPPIRNRSSGSVGAGRRAHDRRKIRSPATKKHGESDRGGLRGTAVLNAGRIVVDRVTATIRLCGGFLIHHLCTRAHIQQIASRDNRGCDLASRFLWRRCSATLLRPGCTNTAVGTRTRSGEAESPGQVLSDRFLSLAYRSPMPTSLPADSRNRSARARVVAAQTGDDLIRGDDLRPGGPRASCLRR